MLEKTDIIVVYGSSRDNGDSMKTLKTLLSKTNSENVEIFNISSSDLSYYDYNHSNQDDSFAAVIEKISAAKLVIFCTPVYWYSMSAQMKTFFDRLSDLLTIKKDLGRALKGVKAVVVSNGASPKIPEYFASPFIDTCNYFEMDYKGLLYCSFEGDGFREGEDEKLEAFSKLINKEL